ncbi:GDSL-type esterase/lipase family protein [Sphingomonas sp. KR1UV-12]|uniref:GDSL-type esterase/lipase family protein n=1 Tax=Sphingomonas aurea TaxID=3063994 RepID=A0ABT9EIT7_9SPHN|nr:GDSL-type esterase/lipase family protein [Sphingomonas sp. KR1UV-12]MDP1026716.1 GDSL-type esterase/lipase family protein [Sphingomonas sp. KR1UV-12]
MKRAALLALAALLIGATDAPERYQSSPPRRTLTDMRDWGPWAGPFRQSLIPVLMQDFGERYLYAAANAALPPPRPGERRVVFMGDSITDLWDLSRAFPGKPYVNRGIGAQVTAQMLVRFQQDVVALCPSAVVILAGTNDVQGVLQVETPASIVANIAAMGDIADAHGIRVVLSAILPVNDYTDNARDMLRDRPPAVLRAINADLRALAKRRGYGFADYDPALSDARGMMAARLTSDGLHPGAEGYRLMAPIAATAIDQVLSRPAPRVVRR